MKTEFVNDAKVMAKGQVTIPKNVREALGIDVGDRVTFIVDGSDIKIMNSAVYALKRLQKQMAVEADKAGITSENDIAEWITKSRREENAQ
ncbi:MAG: AbrB/MazE/SpoVT family DNA-binding domain-containing protein [Oribacterium sp.]|nr:AbrB/MazE/SpoVT family DNA-binding domain-containing protein [Oribacterium sp.]